MAPRPRALITERDVRHAARRGEQVLDTLGGKVTPSAMDAAKTLGVRLVTGPQEKAVALPLVELAKPSVLRVAIGADHGGVAMKDVLLAALRERGHTVDDHGTVGTTPVDYPDVAVLVARAVATGGADVGIMIDGAGIGSCMVANKVPGVRAAMCHDVTTATNAREHNNANVLTLGGGLLGTRLALDVVTTFLATSYAGGRHQARVAKIDALDMPTR